MTPCDPPFEKSCLRPCCASVVVAFVLFRQRILFRIQEAVHLISNLWLELVIILFPAALRKPGLIAKAVQYIAHQTTSKQTNQQKIFILYLTHLGMLDFTKKKRAEESQTEATE